MSVDAKRDISRHALATIALRGRVALSRAPAEFHSFQLRPDIRTPGETVAHITDLIEGSHFLMKGEYVVLNSTPGAWDDDLERLSSAIRRFDSFLAADTELALPVERLLQGPIADALTHIGQIIMLRRAAGSPASTENYFSAEIVPGEFNLRFD